MRWLASRFLDVDIQEELGIMTPEVRSRKAAQEALMRGDTAAPVVETNGGGNGNGSNGHTTKQPGKTVAAAEAMTDSPPVIPAKLVGLDLGPACAQCGGMMQRTGSCYTCSSCGNNTGCG
jgi:ribonucleoside-diphosphate reductase alpha chain